MMIDTHCHINDIKYDSDVKEVISRAVESGVKKMICVGTDLKTSEKSIELATESEFGKRCWDFIRQYRLLAGSSRLG